MLIRLFFIFLSLPVSATVFQMRSLDQQIREADGIIVGYFLKKRPIRLDDGTVATQMFFKMNREYGMQSDFLRMDEVIIHYPGGEIDGLHVKVDGVPDFVKGESVVLLIKSQRDRYWGLNLGYGSFKVINYGNEQMIVNTIFPNDRKMGQFRLEEFEKMVKSVKGSNLKVVLTPSYPTETDEERSPASVQDGKNRAIASKSDQRENGGVGTGLSTFWLVFLLAGLGAIFRLIRQKEAK